MTLHNFSFEPFPPAADISHGYWTRTLNNTDRKFNFKNIVAATMVRRTANENRKHNC